MEKVCLTITVLNLLIAMTFAAIAWTPHKDLNQERNDASNDNMKSRGIRPRITAPEGQQVCKSEDMLRMELSISGIDSKVANQKSEICEMKAKVLEMEKEVHDFRHEARSRNASVSAPNVRQEAEILTSMKKIKSQCENETAKLVKTISAIAKKQTDLESRLELQEADIASQAETVASQAATIASQATTIASQDVIITKLRTSLPAVHHSCPDGYTRHGTSCYTFNSAQLTWVDSLVLCKVFGAHLVIVESESEEIFLRTKLQEISASHKVRGVWTAATDAIVEGTWVWAGNGHPVNLTFGNKNNYGNQDCACFDKEDGYLIGDFACRSNFHSICEIELTEN